MASHSALFSLLEMRDEPSQKFYQEAVDSAIRAPQQIAGLTEESVQADVLSFLTNHSDRLAQFFRRLRSVARQNPKSPHFATIATETTNLLAGVLPYLHPLLEPRKVLDFLIPALDVCFAPSQRPVMRELASVLASSGTLLEHLATDHLGVEVIRQWISIQNTIVLDAETLALWTARLVGMMENCVINHNAAHQNEQWLMLKAVKQSLRNVHLSITRSSNESSTAGPRHIFSTLSTMTQLNREDKKGEVAKHRETKSTFPSLNDDDKRFLENVNINIPGSKNSLSEVIKRLEGEKTSAILLSSVSRPPCYLCLSSLEDPAHAPRREKHDKGFQAVSSSHIEAMTKGFGLWNLVLSRPALKSVLHLKNHGLSGSVTRKLKEIASGSWDYQSHPRAGLKHQRKRLKVPVAKTSCVQNHFILWQIVVERDTETGSPQQEITVWEVCEYAEISKILDRVILIQQSYSDETVRRCHQHSAPVDRIQIPTRFEDSSLNTVNLARPSANLDIRTVDQDVIEMTNKFYTLTEPVIRSIISNDLSAEFPFKLSPEESHVIRHYRTASLILGRSGTGKTTCLVFKLVRKLLASKAVAGERPVRQILLTRSSFLANKLNSYTQQLIQSLLPKPDSSQLSELTSPNIVEEDFRRSTVLSLRDTSFPLICTWEDFLAILENTAAKVCPRISHDPGTPTNQQLDQYSGTKRSFYSQYVDFHVFQTDYWPHFSHTLTKDFSVHLIFAEIMGVIKGSASSKDSLEPLSRDQYLSRSCRLAPAFKQEVERSQVYEIFESYQKLKLEHGDVDQVDRVVGLLRAVRQDASLKQLLQFSFHEVFIDEIQDHRSLDIELLLNFISDGRGFHFAGDTAQAISQDSTFRFSDVKTLFYEHFAATSAATHQSELSRPELFTLSKNYRSHEGILALAALVMGMIWKGFPETVDRLEPEIGNINGPRPVLFRGIEQNILRTQEVGHVTLSEGTADFGAEQVILVRDVRMKENLRDQIGDSALILTILESKGMEFDDVLLWNFFTECSDQAGLRSLEILVKEPALFDRARHTGMCSELKHLYVAVTRARQGLFIMETSEKAAAVFLRVFNNNTSEPLVHVTSPGTDDFGLRLEMLRPGTSLDPQQWTRRGDELMHRRMYKDALRCYRKAHDDWGEATAEGHLREEEGRHCGATKDKEGFQRNLDLSIQSFLKVNLIDDAARNYVALGKLEDAAEILRQNKMFSKAARIYAEAGFSTKAIECHHSAGEFSEAAAVINKDRDYDRLVSYLHENRDSIPSAILQGYSRFCKLLLKQKKLSDERRQQAIHLLGSSDEQERFFREYGMDDDLAELYVAQSRHLELYYHYSSKGELERAFKVAVSSNLLQSKVDDLETQILSIMDYVYAGHLERDPKQISAAPLELPPGFVTPQVAQRCEEWQRVGSVYGLEGFIMRQQISGFSNSSPKTFLCFRKQGKAIDEAADFDKLPFEFLEEVTRFIRALIFDKNGDAMKTALLLTGIWKHGNDKSRYTILPWSPIRKDLAIAKNADLEKVVKQWVFDSFVPVIMALAGKVRDLWRNKWPRHCVQFMAVEFCSRKRNGEPCYEEHEFIYADDCTIMLDDLLQINGIFCDLAAIYYRRILDESFQKMYLPNRRHWLERLFSQITYLSSVEQHTSAILKTQEKLLHEKKLVAVSCFIEELLYYRIREDWQYRNSFTSLLEQMQFAKKLGSNVQYRVFRALSHRLFADRRHLLQRHLLLSTSLIENLNKWNPSYFHQNLTLFLTNLENIDVLALSTLHSLTTMFEYLAAYLLLKTYTTSCVLPNSWIDLHVTSIKKITSLSEQSKGDDKHRFHGCLIQVAKGYCRILSRLEQSALPPDFLMCNGRSHKSFLSRQRNAELVAVIVANLAAVSPEPPAGFNEIWLKAKEVFEYDFIKAIHLRSQTPRDLIQNLRTSFARYKGKDSLVVVNENRKQPSPFFNLERYPDVKTIAFSQLCPPPAPAVVFTHNPTTGDTSPAPPGSPHDQYSTSETYAIIKIQRLWRSVSHKIKTRRSYISVPLLRATTHFFNLGTHCPDTVAARDQKSIRGILVLRGVPLSCRLNVAKGSLSQLQEDVMKCIEEVDLGTGVDESVDEILCRNRDVEALLGRVTELLEDKSVLEVVGMGDVAKLKGLMDGVERGVREAEGCLAESRKMVERVEER